MLRGTRALSYHHVVRVEPGGHGLHRRGEPLVPCILVDDRVGFAAKRFAIRRHRRDGHDRIGLAVEKQRRRMIGW
jgi:hypothetical protein